MPEAQRPPGGGDAVASTRIFYRAGQVFRPAAPITTQELFSGRVPQITRVIDAISSPGQHVIIYGERGVGKTSLANILSPTLESLGSPHVFSKINCDSSDSFASLWRKSLQEISFVQRQPPIGFEKADLEQLRSLGELLESDVSPNSIKKILQSFPNLIFIFDEFDRISRDQAAIFTDLIKTLSDYTVPTTAVLVGVADTVENLLADHHSIDRALIQIPMPRMNEDESREILTKAAQELSIKYLDEAAERIVKLSQGLPHYVHLMGLHAVRAAVQRGSLTVTEADLETGLRDALENVSHSIKKETHRATSSVRNDALFDEVLLACALAPKDELSYFQAANVKAPLSRILRREVDIPQFARHLKEFCSEPRGQVLERTGRERHYRYRFRNPLLEPYVVMRGLSLGKISQDIIQTLRTSRRG